MFEQLRRPWKPFCLLPLALTNGGSSTTSGPSLESLVNVINGTTTTSAKAKAKGKSKAKAKTAPKSTLQTPKTPEEHRDAIRFLAWFI